MNDTIAAGAVTSEHLGRTVHVNSLALKATGKLKSVWHRSGYPDKRTTDLYLELPGKGGEVRATLEVLDTVELLEDGEAA